MQSKVWQKLREISFINDLLGLAVLSLDQFWIKTSYPSFCSHISETLSERFLKNHLSECMVCETRRLYVKVNTKPPDTLATLASPFGNHILKSVPLGFYPALVEILLKYFTPSFKWVCHCKTSGRELCKFGGIWHVQIWMFPEGTCFITIKAVEPVWRLRGCLILNKAKCGHPMLHLGGGPIFTIFRLITGLEGEY